MASISTPGSNIPVRDLVNQLMQVERRPLKLSQSRLDSYNTQVSNIGKLKSDLSSLQTALRELSSGTFINVFKADSTDKTVLNATASSSANAGIYNITVSQLAKAQSLALEAKASRDTGLGGGANTLNFTINGTTKSVSIAANASLDDIRSAVNAAGIGINATIVNNGDASTPYRLVFTSAETGTNAGFTTSLASADANLNFLTFNGTATASQTLTAAKNAKFSVNGLDLESQSNTAKDAVAGVELKFSKEGTANLTVSRDSEEVLKKVQGFVDAYNKVKATVDSLYKVESTAQTTDVNGNALPALKRLDYSMVSIMQRFQSALSTPIAGADPQNSYAYLSQVGISIQKDGTLKLDSDAFKKAMDKDLSAVTKLFSNSNNDGFAERINKEINGLLGPNGLIESRTNSLNAMIGNEKMQQDRLSARMESLEKRYMREFSSLDAALSKINQTSSYLARILR